MATLLVCSVDPTLSDLMRVNLERRSIGVHQATWAPCCGAVEDAPKSSAPLYDVLIADLDCPEPACWRGPTLLRQAFPSVPIVILTDCWPSSGRLKDCAPCRYIHKPFTINELLCAVRELARAG
jgi:DNA-binding response OmpR family regulator